MRKSILVGILGVAIITGALIAGFSQSQVVGAPYAQTLSAMNVFNTGATLQGQITANGYATYYIFDYGTDQSMSNSTSELNVSNSFSPMNVSYNLTNLLSGTTYYFRVRAISLQGNSVGQTMSFTTSGSNTSSNPGVTVTTNPATNITSTSATLHASGTTVDGQGTVSFQYGSTIFNLDRTVIGTVVGNSNQTYLSDVYYNATGLIPNATYYFRAYIQDAGVVTYGQLQTFQTMQTGYISPYSQMPIYTQPSYYPTYPSVSYTPPQTRIVYVPQTTQSETQYVYQPEPYTYASSPYNVAYNYYYNTNPNQYLAYGYYPQGYAPATSNYYGNPLSASAYSTAASSSWTILGYGLLIVIIVLIGVAYFKSR